LLNWVLLETDWLLGGVLGKSLEVTKGFADKSNVLEEIIVFNIGGSMGGGSMGGGSMGIGMGGGGGGSGGCNRFRILLIFSITNGGGGGGVALTCLSLTGI